MKLKDLYSKIIDIGIRHDRRDRKEIQSILKKEKEEYSKLSGDKKKMFDKDRLINPYSDTRILTGNPDTEVKIADLQNPDQEINEKCTIGELGSELETHLENLTTTIGSLRNQVEGGGLSYSKKDSVKDMFEGVTQSGGYAVSKLANLLKVLGVFLVLCAIAFFALFFTMDTEDDILGQITTNEAHIRSQQEILSGLDRETKELVEQTRALEHDDISRQEKLSLIDLNLQIHALEQRRQKVQLQIQVQLDDIKKHRLLT